MSRTRKRYPSRCYKHPRGRRRAILNNVRKGAIPPDAWDDRPHDKSAWLPSKIVRHMKKDGRSREDVIRTLKSKFKLKNHEIDDILEWNFDR